MTEQQQYRVIADRDKGDDVTGVEQRPGDRVVYHRTAFLQDLAVVRIERPVPTTDDPQKPKET